MVHVRQTRVQVGREGENPLSRWAAVLLLPAFVSCDVEWGGGQISLENPAPPADTAGVSETLEPEQIALPSTPHLYLVRLEPDGSARSVAIAQMGPAQGDALFSAVEIPLEDPSYRARFDSAFLAPQTEFELLARGGRVGTLVLDSRARSGSGSCVSIATGQAIFAPGQDVPRWAFAAPLGTAAAGLPRRIDPSQIESSMARAGPVLAENLIGGNRAFLARRVAMTPVRLAGDSLSGMAATFLIADSLAAGPPGENAVSLFFIARREPSRGFIPIWQELRRYNSEADKESFEYIDWIPLAAGRVDVLRRYGGTTVQLALGLTATGSDSEIIWTEPAACASLPRIDGE